MLENMQLGDLSTPEGLAGLKDYLLRLGEDSDVIYTETAPNGVMSAMRGKSVIYKNGSTYEVWQNMDGSTTWQRIDNGLSIPLTYLDTDGTLAANSDTKVASQKATKTYADTKIPKSDIDTTTTLGTSDTKVPSQNAVKTYVDNLPDPDFPNIAGAVLIASADTLRTTTSTNYVKCKEIYIGQSGTLRIKFTLDNTNAGGGNVYGRIYKNGVAVGTERSQTSTDATEYSEDIAGWVRGDLCQIYHKQDASAESGITNFRIYTGSPVIAGVITD